MELDGRQLLAHIRRLGAIDVHARRRLTRLMGIGDMEASAVLALAGDQPLTSAAMQAQLDLSSGGAVAFSRILADRALVRTEPDPTALQLRLSDGAAVELSAALFRLIEGLDAVAARLSDSETRVVARFLDALADAG